MRGWSLLLLGLLLSPVPGWGQGAGPPAPPVRLYAVGDLLFGRYLPGPDGHGKRYAPVCDAADPFAAVAPTLREADVVFGNLETPVMEEPARFSIHRNLTFRADPDRVPVLARAGFHVLSLANNHMTNLGAAGAPRTRGLLAAAGLAPVGAGADLTEALRPQVIERRGMRLAFLALTLWSNDGHPITPRGAVAYVRHRDFRRHVVPRVRALRRDTGADAVIVSLHWGREYEPHPDDAQREQAHALIDAGADVVLGHHPHVLQDFERYHGGLIAYSLGNFLFDNPGISRRRTVILRLALSRTAGGRPRVEPSLVPVLADARDATPRLASGSAYRELVQRLRWLAPSIPLAAEPRPGRSPSRTSERAAADLVCYRPDDPTEQAAQRRNDHLHRDEPARGAARCHQPGPGLP